jgi:hypothetical protein
MKARKLDRRKRDANHGENAIALNALAGALRAVEKRAAKFDGAALVLHADGSGRVTAGDDERTIFDFDYPRHLARWVTATDAERIAIEAARAEELERASIAQFEEFEAGIANAAGGRA